MNLPAASITVAPAGVAADAPPTVLMRPPSITITVLATGVPPLPSIKVPPRTTVTKAA